MGYENGRRDFELTLRFQIELYLKFIIQMILFILEEVHYLKDHYSCELWLVLCQARLRHCFKYLPPCFGFFLNIEQLKKQQRKAWMFQGGQQRWLFSPSKLSYTRGVHIYTNASSGWTLAANCPEGQTYWLLSAHQAIELQGFCIELHSCLLVFYCCSFSPVCTQPHSGCL